MRTYIPQIIIYAKISQIKLLAAEERKTDVERDDLVIIIKDQGIGMSEEQLQFLFRKYEKRNIDKSGQGIGLFMVKKLVDNFNGSIDVDSTKHVGTTVTVKLPLP